MAYGSTTRLAAAEDALAQLLEEEDRCAGDGLPVPAGFLRRLAAARDEVAAARDAAREEIS